MNKTKCPYCQKVNSFKSKEHKVVIECKQCHEEFSAELKPKKVKR